MARLSLPLLALFLVGLLGLGVVVHADDVGAAANGAADLGDIKLEGGDAQAGDTSFVDAEHGAKRNLFQYPPPNYSPPYYSPPYSPPPNYSPPSYSPPYYSPPSYSPPYYSPPYYSPPSYSPPGYNSP